MFYGLKMRIKMSKMLKRLNLAWGDNNSIQLEKSREICTSSEELRILRALQNCGCIEMHLAWNDGYPYFIKRGDNEAIYTIQRSELWVNRIVSFIAGILTTVIADLIIRSISIR